MEKRIAESLA